MSQYETKLDVSLLWEGASSQLPESAKTGLTADALTHSFTWQGSPLEFKTKTKKWK